MFGGGGGAIALVFTHGSQWCCIITLVNCIVLRNCADFSWMQLRSLRSRGRWKASSESLAPSADRKT